MVQWVGSHTSCNTFKTNQRKAHPSAHPLIHPLVRSFIRQPTHPLARSFIRLPARYELSLTVRTALSLSLQPNALWPPLSHSFCVESLIYCQIQRLHLPLSANKITDGRVCTNDFQVRFKPVRTRPMTQFPQATVRKGHYINHSPKKYPIQLDKQGTFLPQGHLRDDVLCRSAVY